MNYRVGQQLRPQPRGYNSVKSQPIFNFFTRRFLGKFEVKRLLTTPPDRKHVATLPCNLSFIACFLTLVFHKVVWQHMQDLLGFLMTTLLQITTESFSEKKTENRLKFDRIMSVSLWSQFFGPLCSLYRHAVVTGESRLDNQ